MKKKIVACMLLTTVIMSGCGDISLSTGSKNEEETKETTDDSDGDKSDDASENDSKEDNASKEDSKNEDEDSAKESDDASKDASEETDDKDSSKSNASSEFGPEEGLYDRTYLVKEDDGYVYRLEDEDLIAKYDELYEDAFNDTIESYEEMKSMMEEGRSTYDNKEEINICRGIYSTYDSKADAFANKDGSPEYSPVDEKKDFELREFGTFNFDGASNGTQKLGSFYEMDYGFDINNVGYTYVDLNSDGIFELIFGFANGGEWTPTSIFERAYTLIDNKPVRIFEGGSRCYLWLGDDGGFYETGSSGAAYSGIWKYHFDPSKVEPEGTTWGNSGFVEDEFVGMWDVYVHVEGEDTTDLDSASKKPEYQITSDDMDKLYEEWEARRVDIDWLKMSEYMEDH